MFSRAGFGTVLYRACLPLLALFAIEENFARVESEGGGRGWRGGNCQHFAEEVKRRQEYDDRSTIPPCFFWMK